MALPRQRRMTLALTLGLLAVVATPADAGFLDGIMSSIKGLFGGGKSKEVEAFGEALDQVERSQQAVFDLEKQIIERYNASEQVSATDPEVQDLLNQLSDASRTNEDMYLQLLQGRAQAQEAGADLKEFQERLDAIQANQRRLEEGYQEIQNYNKDTGFFEPPPTEDGGVGGQVAESPGGEVSMDQFLNDPRVQGYIDEWLAMNGLDEWGRTTGAVEGGMIKANYNPDTDNRARHRYVWDHLWQKTGGGSKTLRQYVMERLDGATPGQPPGSGTPPSGEAPVALAGQAGGQTSIETGGLPTAPAGGRSLAEVNKEYTDTQQELQRLMAQGQGDSVLARQVQSRLKTLEAQRNGLLAQGGGN